MRRRAVGVAAVLALLGASSAGAAIRYLAFGDSITRGSNCPAQGPLPTKIFDELGPGCDAPCNDQAGTDACAYGWRLEDALIGAGVDAEVVNAGRGGETTAQGVTRIEALLDQGADILLLMEGTNDVFQGINPEAVPDNLAVMDDKAAARGIDTVFGTVIHTLDQDNEPPTQTLRNELIALAAARNRYLADHWQVLCPTPACFDEHYSAVESVVGHVDASGYDVMAGVWFAALTAVGPPAEASPVAPSGNITVAHPTFVWSRIGAANWYELSVESASGDVLDAWYMEDEACFSATECSVTPAEPLDPGSYTWRIRTRNPYDLGPWSAPLSFSIVDVESLQPAGLDVDPSGLGGNHILEPGEIVGLVPQWSNLGEQAVSTSGILTSFTGPDGASYAILADSVHYSLPAHATGSCLDTEDGCYELTIQLQGAARPGLHWDAGVAEEIQIGSGAAPAHTWTLHVGASFADVPPGSPFYPAIETLLHHGVTGGCTAVEYCPAGDSTRGQMAVFLLQAAEGGRYQPAACIEGQELFADVRFDSAFCPWVEELAARGVSSGCGGGYYCPRDPVTRAQMAVLLLKALDGEHYAPPACAGVFADVACPSLFADWIEELESRGITSGCAVEPRAYCPAAAVTRAQMAVFVAKAFGLTLYGP